MKENNNGDANRLLNKNSTILAVIAVVAITIMLGIVISIKSTTLVVPVCRR